MTLTHWIKLLWATTLGALATVGLVNIGCSSSSPAEGGVDASPHDSSTKTDTAADAPAQKDAGTKDAHEAGPDCGPSADASSFEPTTYVAAVGHQGVCSPSAIATFVDDCITMPDTTGSETACMGWIDGGASTDCLDCIAAPDNNGAVWVDPAGSTWPNWWGCIQLSDPKNGAECATAWETFQGCLDLGCDVICDMDSEQCGGAGCTDCYNKLQEGTCKPYVPSKTCIDDVMMGGAAAACFNSSGGQAENYTYVTSLICGGSPADAGHD
jgi:hypothetical protein